jgi:hypothetical protein
VSLVKRLVADGRLHRRTVVHREGGPELLAEYAREVTRFVKDARIDPAAFLKELARIDPGFTAAMRRPRRRGVARRVLS